VDTASQPIGSVTVDPRGQLEVEVEHGVTVTKPHGGVDPRAPHQASQDLSPDEEAALIRGGWQ
jgi:hypothetical protein